MASPPARRRGIPAHAHRRHGCAAAHTSTRDGAATTPITTVIATVRELHLAPEMTSASASTVTMDLPLATRSSLSARRTRRTARVATLTPGMRIGAWLVEGELGRGGMATVYAVVHTQFGKRAALKLAHSAILGPKLTRETFLREARMANLIDHAGVAEVFATGSYGGRPYLVMERLLGQSLGGKLAGGTLPHDQALDLLVELCDVLSAAHLAGITHRDLKVDNVFVSTGGPRIRLLDWGMARVANEPDPLRGLIAGTLTYVAPEQVRGDDITPAADVYSLAVLCYQLLLGEPPFAAIGDLELLDKHLRQQPPRPSAWWPAIPAELDAVLLAMLAKRPEDRPGLAEVVQALRGARTRATQPRGLRLPAVLPPDVLGRHLIAWLAASQQRVAGVALALALTLTDVILAISA